MLNQDLACEILQDLITEIRLKIDIFKITYSGTSEFYRVRFYINNIDYAIDVNTITAHGYKVGQIAFFGPSGIRILDLANPNYAQEIIQDIQSHIK